MISQQQHTQSMLTHEWCNFIKEVARWLWHRDTRALFFKLSLIQQWKNNNEEWMINKEHYQGKSLLDQIIKLANTEENCTNIIGQKTWFFINAWKIPAENWFGIFLLLRKRIKHSKKTWQWCLIMDRFTFTNNNANVIPYFSKIWKLIWN